VSAYKSGGVWRYRNKAVRLPDGRTTKISGTPNVNTKAAAEAEERKHIARVETDPDGLRAKRATVPTLRAFIEQKWETYEKGGGRRGINEVTTLTEKRGHLRLHILPGLGRLPLNRIDNEAVSAFFGELRTSGYHRKGHPVTSDDPTAVRKRRSRAKLAQEKGGARPAGLSEKTIRNIRATLCTVLDRAKAWGYLDALPDLPEVTPPPPSFDWYQPHEAAQLLAAIDDPWEHALILFALHTGFRKGEQRAIRWTDVDFDRGVIHLRQNAPSGLNIIKAPKSDKPRGVHMTPELVAALKAIKHSGVFIFCNDDGSMLSPDKMDAVYWRARARTGLRRIRWHEFRHTYVSTIVSGGTPLLFASALAGHSSVQTTERYAHLAPTEAPAYLRLLSAATPGQRGAKPTGTDDQRPS
jgi:integrase